MKYPFHTSSRSQRNIRKKIFFLFLFSLFTFLLIILLILVPPSTTITIASLSISILPFFLFLLFGVLFTFCIAFFNSVTHGILLGLFVICYLLLRINELTHPFFLILLFAIFLTLELMVSYRK